MKNTKIILKSLFGKKIEIINKFIALAKETELTLEPLFEGDFFSERKYTSAEHVEIFRTLSTLIPQQFNNVTTQKQPTYTASGGAPGSGKTYALEKMFDINVTEGKFPKNAIYIGPDSVVLPQMKAYVEDCKILGTEESYGKWRSASIFITNFMLLLAIVNKFNIVHDTTATNDKMKNILDTLGKENYKRHLHFYFVPNTEDRIKAITQRKLLSGSTKVTDEDIRNKAIDAYKTIADNRFIGRVDFLTLNIQQGQFWLGIGTTTPIAIYNPEYNQNIQIIEGGKMHINKILEQIKNEELRNELESTITSWKEEPATISRKLRM